ncbi:MAG: hypothetical protein ACREJO_09180 [Phycisphaerales bacterium]
MPLFTLQRVATPHCCHRWLRWFAALFVACLGAHAQAQLREDQVLVVYDSRIVDSLAVAEYYAGSPKVPGGAGALHGIRPGVRVMDLAATSQPAMGIPDIDYATFTSRLRDPIRAHLTATDPTDIVRCIVLTKGIPHRILDQTSPTVGDEPWNLEAPFNAGNLTYASVDSELVLLWQTLNDGANGQSQGSRAAGIIINPYWRASQPISKLDRPNLHTQKSLQPLYSPPAGILWRTLPTGPALTAGDMYLVCRLDADTVAGVRTIIDRAQTRYVDMNTGAIILDETASNGVADTTPVNSPEFDNQDFGDTVGDSYLWGGDDYEQTRNLATTDGRWTPGKIYYDGLSGAANYILGPRLSYTEGIFVSDPVVLLTSEANNANVHGTVPGGGSAGPQLVNTLFWAPMGVCNTLESYNARALGGLDRRFNQTKIGEALASGVTFFIGDVWEPYSSTIPDSLQLLSHFFLGDMCWAEAAYTALPAISWQAVVVGDPLARVQRSSEDIDADQRVTIDDAYRWEVVRTDINRSGSGNNTDRQIIERSLRAGEFQDLRGTQRP